MSNDVLADADEVLDDAVVTLMGEVVKAMTTARDVLDRLVAKSPWSAEDLRLIGDLRSKIGVAESFLDELARM